MVEFIISGNLKKNYNFYRVLRSPTFLCPHHKGGESKLLLKNTYLFVVFKLKT